LTVRREASTVHSVSGKAPRQYTFDFTKQASFEIGAWLMAILAFPADGEVELRREAAEGLCADAVRMTCVADPTNAAAWQAEYPVYAAIDPREQRRRLRTLLNRLKRGMQAARMSLGFLEEGVSGGKARLPPGMAKLNIDSLSRLLQDQSYESDPHNLEHRVWRKTRPVIHLAAAFQMVARYASPEPGRDDVGYPLANGDLHQAVIDLAGRYEPIVLADKRFGIRPDMLIRLRRTPAPGPAQ
jgi:hypothetical protein